MLKKTAYTTLYGCRFLQNISPITQEISLVHCGVQECPSLYSYDHKIPNEYHLHFVLSGKGEIQVDGTPYPVHQEQIFLIPKDIPFAYHADQEDPWKYFWITINGSLCVDYLAHIGLSPQTPVVTSRAPVETYLPTIERILQTNELTYANEIRRQGLLFQLISDVIDVQNAGSENLDYPTESYVSYALEYIKNNFNHITVHDVAKHIGLNRSHFTTLFKKEMSVSPQAYLVNYKLSQAAILLTESHLPMREIADYVGYDNQDTFSKAFKQHFQQTPSLYRQENQPTHLNQLP